MTDIEQVLRDAAPTPRELVLDELHRDGIRRRRRPWKIAGAMLVVGVIATAAFFALGEGETRRVVTPPATQPSVTTTPPTTAPVTTTATAPPPTATDVVPQPTLSSQSLLGYAGLGPVTLGMTLAEASHAAGTPIATGTIVCNAASAATADAIWPPSQTGSVIFGVQGDTIATVLVFDPRVSTISGIHVGSSEADVLATYPNAVIGKGVQGNRALRITDSNGREIVLYEDSLDTPGTVGAMVAAASPAVENVGSC